jgi:hypothetical protein
LAAANCLKLLAAALGFFALIAKNAARAPRFAAWRRVRLASASRPVYPERPPNEERTMKRLAFAIGVLALGFAASTPARADYALVRFESGFCRIWWDSAGNPLGVGWMKVAVGLPDYEAAVLALNMAVGQGVCR